MTKPTVISIRKILSTLGACPKSTECRCEKQAEMQGLQFAIVEMSFHAEFFFRFRIDVRGFPDGSGGGGQEERTASGILAICLTWRKKRKNR